MKNQTWRCLLVFYACIALGLSCVSAQDLLLGGEPSDWDALPQEVWEPLGFGFTEEDPSTPSLSFEADASDPLDFSEDFPDLFQEEPENPYAPVAPLLGAYEGPAYHPASGKVPLDRLGGVEVAGSLCEEYEGSNIEAQNYSDWASPITSHLYPLEDGRILRVQYLSNRPVLLLDTFDSGYHLVECKTLPLSLPLYGGFHLSTDACYVVSGQANEEGDDEKVVYRIDKYTRDYQWISACEIKGKESNTAVPFDAGSLRFAEDESFLFLATGRKMYIDGSKGHQASFALKIDKSTMEPVNRLDGYWTNSWFRFGYVSHSFNQFLAVEDHEAVYVNHGDAFPRSLSLTIPKRDSDHDYEYLDVLLFPGEEGENYTGVSLGGFVATDTHYLIAGNQAPDFHNTNCRDIFVAAVDKATRTTQIRMLTQLSGTGTSTTTPHLADLGEGRLMILWSSEGMVCYATLNGRGEVTSEVFRFPGNLSDCVPVVIGNKLVWYTLDRQQNTVFYEIDLQDLGSHQVFVHRDGHRPVYGAASGRYIQGICEKCQKSITSALPRWLWIYLHDHENFSQGYENRFPQAGEVIDFWISAEEFPDETTPRLCDVLVTSSNPQVMQVVCRETVDRLTEGELRALKKGKATITITSPYDPSLEESFTFCVDVPPGECVALTCENGHRMTPGAAKDGYLTAHCDECGAKTTLALPSRLWLYLHEHGVFDRGYENRRPEIGEIIDIWISAEDFPDETTERLCDIRIESSNPDVIQVSARGPAGSLTEGELKVVGKGMATITFTVRMIRRSRRKPPSMWMWIRSPRRLSLLQRIPSRSMGKPSSRR